MTRALALRDALARRPHLAAALAYLLAVVVWLGPALWGSSVLTGASALWSLLPWRAVGTPGGTHVNGLLSDAAVDFWPWFEHARAHLRAGDLPGWNPYVLGGTPFFANPQTSLLSPFSLPAWLLPLHVAYGVMGGLKLWVAALGGYALLRRLGAGWAPALLSGFALAGCAYLTGWLSHPHSDVFPLVPWALLGAELCLGGSRRAGAVVAAVAVGVAMLGGHPGTQVHLGAGLALWTAVRALSAGRPARDALGGIAWLLAGAVVGLLLGAAAWVPSTLALRADGSTSLREGEPALQHAGFLSLVVPDWWGRPSRVDYGGPFNYNERTVYVGIVTLLLAPLAPLLGRTRRDRPWVAPLVLVLFGFGAAYGLPGLGWVNGSVPPLSLVGGQRVMLLAQVGLVVLAGLGAQALLERAGELRARRTATVVALGATAALLALLVLLGAIGLRTPGGSGVLEALRPRSGDERTARLVAVGAAAGFSALLVALVALLGRPGRRPWVAAGLVVLVVADVGTFAHGYQPLVPRDVAFPAATPAIRALQAQTRVRMAAVAPTQALLPDSTMAYGLRTIGGHDPPQPDAAYGGLLTQAGLDPSGLFFRTTTVRTDRVLDLLGVDHVYLEPGARVPAGWRTTYRGRDGTVAENPGARPRAFVPGRVQTSASVLGQLILVLAGDRPAVDSAVLAPGGPGAGSGRVSGLRDTDDAVSFRADMRVGGLVVLTDRLADGWSVTVDGRRATPLRVDRALRGVAVPAGRHEVRWSYAIPGLRAGIVLSVLGLLGLAALAALGAVSPRRARRRAG